MKPIVVFIAGPTSSGKTDTALSLARILKTEIISCDSMQVYKGMDILTHAPSDDILKEVKHHLVKFIPLEEEYNAVSFKSDAEKIIARLAKDGKIPIISGGTGLYMKILMDGIFEGADFNSDLRNSLEKRAEKEGGVALHDELQKIDPVTAKKLFPNDVRRVIRALEVYHTTGTPMSEKKKDLKDIGIAGAYDCRMFGLSLERNILYDRINNSVDKMLGEWLVQAVERILKKTLSKTAAKALGIKEIKAYLNGGWTLDKAVNELKKNTRHYAKRQLTWFRAEKKIKWLDADKEPEKIAREILGEIKII
ncbi:tRNA delta(2)-isopentenylpyrophosphate transferase [Candidatus Omnitrophus magneticus]|uniref:tRNA dimethylallyltransferase n=1 Tax=Candidatus Omnitrophus magneticus TaxID=1609969 RepID=A0A0F0CP68_9BACT|nr:tRNA delta(2)-isopentenylpyrophosphate transferase [Candidatus Omnitrophus magneticus]